MEERLDRLERMVKSLLSQQKRARTDLSAKESTEFNPMASSKAFGDFRADAKRETARAAEMEKRATKEAEKAMKLEAKLREKGPVQEGFQTQIQALQQAREALQREMQKLERQIERIQRQHEKIEAEKWRDATEEAEDSKDSEPRRK